MGDWLGDWFKHAAETVGDGLFGTGPQTANDAMRYRNAANQDRARMEALMNEVGTYDPSVADDYYQQARADLERNYYGAAGGAAAQMARRGLGNSGMNSAEQSGLAMREGQNLAAARRDAIMRARQDRMAQIGQQANILSGLWNSDAANAGAAAKRKNAIYRMIHEAGGTALGAWMGGGMGAKAGGQIGKQNADAAEPEQYGMGPQMIEADPTSAAGSGDYLQNPSELFGKRYA